MKTHRAFIVLLIIASLLLGPAEAGLLSWIAEKFGFLNPLRLLPGYNRANSFKSSNNFGSTNSFGTNGIFNNDGNGDQIFSGATFTSGTLYGSQGEFADGIDISGPLVYNNGQIQSGAIDSRYFGSVFKVRTRRYKGKDGNREEEIMVVWLEKKSGKTIYTKCKGYGTSRRIVNKDKLLLVGNPNDNFCAFTTNKKEIFYLNNGKWKKGDINGDNTNDKELTSSEISKVQERINKWNAYLERIEKEKQRIRSLKDQEKEKFRIRKEDIKALREKEKEKHRGIRDNIKELKRNERDRHKLEMQSIRDKRRAEGWSEEIKQLELDEDNRQSKEESKLNQMEKDEERRYSNEYNRYSRLLDEEEVKKDKQITKLAALRNEADKKALKELEKMINQGL